MDRLPGSLDRTACNQPGLPGVLPLLSVLLVRPLVVEVVLEIRRVVGWSGAAWRTNTQKVRRILQRLGLFGFTSRDLPGVRVWGLPAAFIVEHLSSQGQEPYAPGNMGP